MNEEREPRDFGPSVGRLTALAWLLALLALGCLVRLLTYADRGIELRTEMLAWVLAGVFCAAFSAACAVLVGVKGVEQRLEFRLSSLAESTN